MSIVDPKTAMNNASKNKNTEGWFKKTLKFLGDKGIIENAGGYYWTRQSHCNRRTNP